MWTFCLCCLFFTLISGISCFSFLSDQFVFLQHWCFNSIPVEQADGVLWQALVCARSLPQESKWKLWLQISGLIHLFVVSGSHFLVLEWILEKCKAPHVIKFFTLWLYNAVTGFSPPGTRACLNLSCGFIFKVFDDQKTLAIGLLCLALQPSWILSHSFWLSWLASLILIVTPQFKIEILRNFIFYFVWLLLGFSISIWSVPLNLIVGPFISWILFPLAFLSYIPGVPWIFHQCSLGLEFILSFFSNDLKNTPMPAIIPQLAGLVLLTHFVLQIRRLSRQGKIIS